MPCHPIQAARHFSFNGFANFKPFKPANASFSAEITNQHPFYSLLIDTVR